MPPAEWSGGPRSSFTGTTTRSCTLATGYSLSAWRWPHLLALRPSLRSSTVFPPTDGTTHAPRTPSVRRLPLKLSTGSCTEAFMRGREVTPRGRTRTPVDPMRAWPCGASSCSTHIRRLDGPVAYSGGHLWIGAAGPAAPPVGNKIRPQQGLRLLLAHNATALRKPVGIGCSTCVTRNRSEPTHSRALPSANASASSALGQR